MVVQNLFRIIRNNWKKSITGTAIASYGISYGINIYDTEQAMRRYCEDVVRYGDVPCSNDIKPRHVTVILNPAANKRKAKKLFEKYCEPLLHLAGIAVTIIQSESNNQIRNLVENLDVPTDAIIVAGGDGTLSDVVTGLMRKYNHNISHVKRCPIGILPLGERNRIANSLYHKHDNLSNVYELMEATLGIIKGSTKLMDVIEIECTEQVEEQPIKPVYALGVIEWGIWPDVNARIKKYWYWGPLREYVAYVFNGYKEELSWMCNAILRYSAPCNGCSRCYQEQYSFNQELHSNKRWWHAFVPREKNYKSDNSIDYSKVINEKCGTVHEIPISTTELYIQTANVNNASFETSLKVQLGPKDIDYISFVTEGWGRIKGKKLLVDQSLQAGYLELYPEKNEKDQIFFIDNEEFELKPVKIKLIAHAIKMFCSELNTST